MSSNAESTASTCDNDGLELLLGTPEHIHSSLMGTVTKQIDLDKEKL